MSNTLYTLYVGHNERNNGPRIPTGTVQHTVIEALERVGLNGCTLTSGSMVRRGAIEPCTIVSIIGDTDHCWHRAHNVAEQLAVRLNKESVYLTAQPLAAAGNMSRRSGGAL